MMNTESTFTFEEAVEYIEGIPRFTKKTSVDHTRHLLQLLGNPCQNRVKAHIAGTNGKGSICACLTDMFSACGLKVGLFISPHLVKINERMSVNRVDISDEDFTDIFLEVLKAARKQEELGEQHPTYFEFLFAMGMLYFEKQDVDLAVLEVGMGGRLDATNSIIPDVCAIASISFDHTEYLGDTLELIAGEKAGIIKAGVPVVHDATVPEANAVFEKKASELGCRIEGAGYEDITVCPRHGLHPVFALKKGMFAGVKVEVPFPADYQMINASVALLAAERLFESEKLKSLLGGMSSEEFVQTTVNAVAKVTWPCRMQEARPGVYIDGAHNSDAVEKLLAAVKCIPCEGKCRLLFTVVKDKDIDTMVRLIAQSGVFIKVYTVTLDSYRRTESAAMAARFNELGLESVSYEDTQAGFRAALAEKEQKDLLICAGSLYLAGELERITAV